MNARRFAYGGAAVAVLGIAITGCWQSEYLYLGAAPDTDTDTDSDTDVDTDADSDTDTDSDTDGDTDTSSETETATDTGTDTETGSETDTGVEPPVDCGAVVHDGSAFVSDPASIAALAGVTYVTGDVLIDGTALESLGGLEALACVGGDLTILNGTSWAGDAWLDGLAGLAWIGGSLALTANQGAGASPLGRVGLTSLARVEGDLTLEDDLVSSLAGLEALASIGGSLRLDLLPALADLDGLVGLTAIGGSLGLHGLETLVRIDGLAALAGPLQILSVDDCPALASLAGLGGVSAATHLAIEDAEALADLEGLGGITAVSGSARISHNGSLQSLTGLSSLGAVGEDLEVWWNPALLDLGDLPLTAVGVELQLTANDSLATLAGLSHLESVGDLLLISGNASLTTLDGLDAVAVLGHDLFIQSNPALIEVDALDGITAFSAHLAIRDNLSLPTCAAVQLKQHLEEIGTITELELWGNAPDPEAGCDGVDPWAGADGDVDSDADTDTDPQCAAEPDFAPCALDTTATAGADLLYDLCAEGACVSPGTCLDAACNTTGPHGPIAADTPSGFARSEPFAGEPVVDDPLTGLTWQGCEAGLSGAACGVGTATEIDWVPAILYCDDLSWGGYDDWHLPNLYELLSIAGVDGTAPAFDPVAFPASSDVVPLFSIESCYTAPEKAYSFDPLYRLVYGYQKNDWGCRVRCVRGAAGDLPLVRFSRAIVDGRPVVDDAVTGLMWQGCAAGQTGDHCTGYYPFGFSQPGAADYCDALVWGGRDDWRLPGAKELASLNDLRAGPPAVPIDPGAFPSTPTQAFWASSAGSADYEDTGQTAVFERVFVLGGMYTVIWPLQRRTTTSALVRCVREAP